MNNDPYNNSSYNNDSYFVKHQSSFLFIIVAVLLTLGLLIWISIAYHTGPFLQRSEKKTITDEEIQAIIKSQTPPGPDKLSQPERAYIKDSGSAPAGDNLTPEQRAEIINSTTAK